MAAVHTRAALCIINRVMFHVCVSVRHLCMCVRVCVCRVCVVHVCVIVCVVCVCVYTYIITHYSTRAA